MNMEVQRVPKKSQAHLLLNLVFPHLILGKKVYPHFNLESNSTADANYCQLAIWNADGTAKTTQDKTDGNILHPAMPLDPAEAHQYAVYCSLKTLTEEEKAQYPGLVLNVFDLYDENGTARLPMTSLVRCQCFVVIYLSGSF